jgi:hypothetical protein
MTYQGPKTLAEFYAQRDGWRTCTNTRHPHHWNVVLPNGNFGSAFAPRPHDGPFPTQACPNHAHKKRGPKASPIHARAKLYRDAGFSMKEIAEVIGVSRARIWQVLTPRWMAGEKARSLAHYRANRKGPLKRCSLCHEPGHNRTTCSNVPLDKCQPIK